jgi:lipopolysaccharide transport system ATP-binding protein
MAMTPFLQAENLILNFPLIENYHRSIKKRALNFSFGSKITTSSSTYSYIRALDNINLNLVSGDRLGISGNNGSGKSTLLRVLSGIYAPTYGSIKSNGRIASLLDIAVGLDQDSTGLENIYIRCILNGLMPSDIKNKIDEIIDFCELDDFIHLPIRTYSSGMLLRLAFAISTSIEAEILIMDEWMSVGDIAFTEKATLRLQNLVDSASILILATHSPDLINKTCNQMIRLEHGKIVDTKDLLRL